MKIHTEAEYTTALKRIDALMDTAPDTPESAELETLVTAVEAYEAEHYPIGSPTETQALKKLIEASERSGREGLISLDDAFSDPESPFDNPILTPSLDLNGQGYWLGPSGQGIEDALPMREQALAEFQCLIATGKLVVAEERFMPALQQRLTLYKLCN
ncbi:MAG: hypothetical protein V7731_21985 [Amphritea sp.]